MEIQNVEKITNEKWLNLFSVNYKIKDKIGSWIFASRKNTPQLGKKLIPDAVIIVPICKEKVVITKEFRLPLGDMEFGFPAGLFDANETIEDVAKRELKEETGLDLTKIIYISPPSVSSAGLSDESVVFVVCECEGEISNEGNQDVENIEAKLYSLEEFKVLVFSGAKISAKALPFYFTFEAMGKIAWPVIEMAETSRERIETGNLLAEYSNIMNAKGAESKEAADFYQSHIGNQRFARLAITAKFIWKEINCT